MADYKWRWLAHPNTVIHPSGDWAVHGVNSLVETDTLPVSKNATCSLFVPTKSVSISFALLAFFNILIVVLLENFTGAVFICLISSTLNSTLRYDTRRYFNVCSKADVSQLNLPHGTNY